MHEVMTELGSLLRENGHTPVCIIVLYCIVLAYGVFIDCVVVAGCNEFIRSNR